MYAVIETGSKQYKVQKGDKIEIEKIDVAVDSEYIFDKVLMLSDEEGKAAVGTPYLPNVKVRGKVLKQFKDEKVIVFKFKKRKNYRRTRGHRQQLTQVEILELFKEKK